MELILEPYATWIKWAIFIILIAFSIVIFTAALSFLVKQLWKSRKFRQYQKLEKREKEARLREDQWHRDNHRHRFELTKGAGPNYIWVCRGGPYRNCPDGYVLSWEKSKFRHMMLTDRPYRVEPYKE